MPRHPCFLLRGERPEPPEVVPCSGWARVLSGAFFFCFCAERLVAQTRLCSNWVLASLPSGSGSDACAESVGWTR